MLATAIPPTIVTRRDNSGVYITARNPTYIYIIYMTGYYITQNGSIYKYIMADGVPLLSNACIVYTTLLCDRARCPSLIYNYCVICTRRDVRFAFFRTKYLVII